MFKYASLLVCLFLLLGVGGKTLPAEETVPERTIIDDAWQVVMIQGQRIGFAHSSTWETGEGADKRIWSESLMQMTLSRFGQTLTMTVKQLTEEDDQGNLLSFRLDSKNPPASHTITSGKVQGETLHLTTTAAGTTTRSEQKWDAEVKSPVYQDRLLQEDPLDVGESRKLRVFDPQFLKPGTVTLTGLPAEATELLDGSNPVLQRTQIVHSLLPLMAMTTYHNEEGETLKSETKLMNMVTYTVSEEEAVKEIAGTQLDLALDTMVQVEPISDAHRKERIEYSLSVKTPQTMPPLPEGATQKVFREDDQTLKVAVRAVDLDDLGESKTEAMQPAEYLAASRHLEVAHPQVIAHAEAAAGDLQEPHEIALAMERYVHEKLASKNFSTALATAAEVASSLEGDCTEHAMLLAAMLRVKEIPSRVVVGLVYSERHSAFVGHMWTEAFLQERWIPLDATLGLGGTGSGHLKFSDSSLSDDGPAAITAFVSLVGLLGNLEIEVID